MAFLVNLVLDYRIEESKDLLNQTTCHGIYRNDGMLVFNIKKSIQEIRDCLVEFQQIVDKVAGKKNLQFTVEIWTNDTPPPPYTKKDKVQTVANGESSFLDMKMSWSSKGYLKFGLFKNKKQKLKYVSKESTHTPGTRRIIPSGVLNRLEKLT